MRTLTLVETAQITTPVRALTLAAAAPIATAALPRPSLLHRLVERIVQWKWPGEATPLPALAHAIDEAFESLAREARS